MCRRCRCRARRSTPDGRRSAPPCRSSATSAFRTSGRRSSSRPASGDGRAAASSTGCSRRHSRVRSTARSASTTSKIPSSSSSVHEEADPLRIARELVDTDIVVCVSAAETVVHGGPGVLLACGGPTPRGMPRRAVAARAQRLARLAIGTRRRGCARAACAAARRVARPRPAADRRGGLRLPVRPARGASASPPPGLRSSSVWLPGFVRLRIIRSLSASITAAGVFAGPPSVAHAEALLRSIALRSIELDAAARRDLPRHPTHDAAYLPRERPNPLLAAYLGLGHALRLWRERPPVVDGGTAILLHRFHRRFAHPTQQPYRRVLPGDPRRARIRARRGGRTRRQRPMSVPSTAIAPVGPAIHCCPYADWEAVRQADRTARHSDRRRLPGCGRSAAPRLRAGTERGRRTVARARNGGRRQRPHRVPALAALLADPRRRVTARRFPDTPS